MKHNKIILVLMFALIVSIVPAQSLAIQNYVITQLTNTSDVRSIPRINDSGIVVWSGGSPSSNEEIFLYNGSTIIQLTDNNYNDHEPEINLSSRVVWAGWDGQDEEVFLYDGASIHQLTDNTTSDFEPKINSHGHVAWRGWDGNDFEIYFDDGSTTIQITDNSSDDFILALSDSGHMLWRTVGVGGGYYLYDSGDIILLTNTGSNPDMNASGHVVWEENFPIPGHPDPGRSQGDLFLYDGNTTERLTDNQLSDHSAQISDEGHISWVVVTDPDRSPESSEIFLYDGETTTQITDNSLYDSRPQVNQSGTIVWMAQEYPGPANDWEIYLYNGTDIIRLTDNLYEDGNPRINARGDVVWTRTGNIFLAQPANIVVSPISHNFERVVVERSSEPLPITIYNYGDVDLVVSEMILSDDINFFLGGDTTPTIEPGGSHAVTVTFSPQSRGQHNATLNITSNDTITPNVEVQLVGEGEAVIWGCINFQGSPLVGVEVRLKQKGGKNQTTITNSEGCYYLDVLTADKGCGIEIDFPPLSE